MGFGLKDRRTYKKNKGQYEYPQPWYVSPGDKTGKFILVHVDLALVGSYSAMDNIN